MPRVRSSKPEQPSAIRSSCCLLLLDGLVPPSRGQRLPVTTSFTPSDGVSPPVDAGRQRLPSQRASKLSRLRARAFTAEPVASPPHQPHSEPCPWARGFSSPEFTQAAPPFPFHLTTALALGEGIQAPQHLDEWLQPRPGWELPAPAQRRARSDSPSISAFDFCTEIKVSPISCTLVSLLLRGQGGTEAAAPAWTCCMGWGAEQSREALAPLCHSTMSWELPELSCGTKHGLGASLSLPGLCTLLYSGEGRSPTAGLGKEQSLRVQGAKCTPRGSVGSWQRPRVQLEGWRCPGGLGASSASCLHRGAPRAPSPCLRQPHQLCSEHRGPALAGAPLGPPQCVAMHLLVLLLTMAAPRGDAAASHNDPRLFPSPAQGLAQNRWSRFALPASSQPIAAKTWQRLSPFGRGCLS